MDSGSTDRTLEICREYTTKVVHRPWSGFVEQKRFALGLCTSDWVLNIDADEEVSVELQQEILETLSLTRNEIAGYELSRVVFYLGKWWRKGGWYPEHRLRLLLRSVTSWGGEDPHEKAIVAGQTARLRNELRHFTYQDISDQIRSLNSHSSAAARSLHRKGERFLVPRMFINPLMRFLKFYLLRKGYREGLRGLMVAVLEGYYVFLKYAKAIELRGL